MAVPKHVQRKTRKRRGKIKFSSSARLVEKNDKTRVATRDTATYKRMPVQMPRSNGVVFKIKMKHK